MRNRLFIIAGMGLAMLATSCSKSFLEQSNPNAVKVDEGFQTEGDIALGINGVYQSLRSGNCIGEGAGTWTDDRSDDINSTDNQSNNGEPFQFTAFSLVASNSYLQSHWSALYAPISRSNVILSYIDNVGFASDATKNQYKGELKFIRAFMYFNLVREFGGVPLIISRVPNNLDSLKKAAVRASREEVYAQIVKDLNEVLNSGLPNVQPSASKGRISLQAVNALLGQVYLTMGATLDAANKTANLNNAKTYLLACYALKGFGKLSDIPFADVFDVNKKLTNQEIILQIGYKQGDPTYASSLAGSNQAKGETINSLVKSTGSGGAFTNDLYKEFEAGDLRTDFSIKYAADVAVKAYFITKFRDNSATATDKGYGGNDWILIRYADVILNIAEVYHLLGDEPNAILYLDMVRARAQRPLYAMMKTDAAYTAKYPTLKLAILHERRVELAFEHHRWHDLIRFFTPEELVTYFRAKVQADYNNSPLTNITTKDYYFPIPLNEYKLNPEKMPQNPGYN
jgi:hypothetical protein